MHPIGQVVARFVARVALRRASVLGAWIFCASMGIAQDAGPTDAVQEDDAAQAAAACLAKVQALFDPGAPNDPFTRPPHQMEQITTDADDTVIVRSILRVETPVRTIANLNESCTLAVEARYWTGPCWDGPWVPGANGLSPDRAEKIREILGQRQANVTNAECLGPVQHHGQDAVAYGYRTGTDKAADGTYSGGYYTVWLDPTQTRWIAWRVTDIVNPWQMEPNGETITSEITYDPSIRVTQPIEGSD